MTMTTPAKTLSDDQIAAVFEDMHEGLRKLPTNANLNDRAKFCIGVCIANGIDTKRHIIGTVRKVGFKTGHVGAMIDSSTGKDPERYLWSLGKDGLYRNLDVSSTIPDLS